MAEVVVVTIEDVSSRDVNTRNGTKTVYNIKASDGRYYGTFDENNGRKAGTLKGQSVRLEYSFRESHKDGKTYQNYDLKGIEANAFAPSPDVPPSAQTVLNLVASQGPSDKDLSIARAVALKAAVETFATGALDLSSAENILAVSDTYVDWLLNGTKEETKADPFEDLQQNGRGDTNEEPVIDQATGELVKF